MKTMPVILADAAHRDLSRLWVVFAVLAVGGLLLYYILHSLKSRRVWLCSKFFSRYYYRDAQPSLFWVTIFIYGVVAMLLLYGGIQGIYYVVNSGR